MLSAVKTVLSMVVPLITFPYISRVLQVEAVGKHNFAVSIVGYFILLADLGIASYAIREGTKLRDDREKFSQFASQMLTIHTISAVGAMVLLALITALVPKLRDYWCLIVILGLQIPLSAFGRQWIYNAQENFGFITMAQAVFQLFSMVLMFLFVHTPEDLYKYTAAYTVSAAGVNVLYGFCSRKYADCRLTGLKGLKKHIKPILIIFSTTVTTTIYVNSDVTILGWMVGDEAVGIYSTAVKVYNIIKHVIAAVITVLIPRLTLYAETKEFKPFFNKVLKTLGLLILPAMTGLFLLSDNVIEILAGAEYLAAATPLRILSIALGFSMFACLYASGVLLPYRREKAFLSATVVSAVVNIVLNFILIPYLSYTAAAFTTLVAELIVLIMCYRRAKGFAPLEAMGKMLLCTGVGCALIIAVCLGIKRFELGLYPETVLCVVISVGVYCVVQLVLKNEDFAQAFKAMLKMLKRKGR